MYWTMPEAVAGGPIKGATAIIAPDKQLPQIIPPPEVQPR